MRSPVFPVVANLYMEHLEQKALTTTPDSCKPRLWKRYVDDILEIVKNDGIQQLTDHLNQVDETHNIQFTYEIEKEGSIPFLDTLITRLRDRNFKFSVYRKTSHTDEYLSFESHNPLHTKTRCRPYTLLNICETVVTDQKEGNLECNHRFG